MPFPRITIRPEQMGGVPCIRGLRIPVVTVVRMVANGLSTAEILDLYPNLEADDVRAALDDFCAGGRGDSAAARNAG
mgnify:CR=1 FL=1